MATTETELKISEEPLAERVLRQVRLVPAPLALTDGRRHEQREAIDAADLARCGRGARARPGRPDRHRVEAFDATYGAGFQASDDPPHAVACKLVEDGAAFVAHRPAAADRPRRVASSTAPYAPRRG